MSDSILEVRDVMQAYLDFVYEGAETLPDIFYANSNMQTSTGTELVTIPCALMAGHIDQRPAAKGEPRVDKILKIDVAGPNLAYAKVKYTTLPHYFTVGFYLAREHGKWLIAAKLFADAADEYAQPFIDYVSHQAAAAKIISVINPYLEALYDSDPVGTVAPFTDDSPMIFTDEDGTIFETNAKAFLYEKQELEEAPRLQGYPPNNSVLDIDFLGKDVAIVKVACAKPPRYFTDYMMMVQVNGLWQICSKTTMTDLH
jgi:hypothetical protein